MASVVSERQYELIYIVAPVATDAEVATLQAEVDGHIGSLGGTVENTDLWGRRKLAYQIGNYGEGIYICQLISGPGTMIGEIERRLRVRDQVLRHLTVRVAEDLRKARRLKEKRKATVDRRRAARGLPPLGVADAAPASPSAAAAPAPPVETPSADTTSPEAPAAGAAAEAPSADPAASAADAAPAPKTEAATPSADVASTDAAAQTTEVKE
ncbi:MAG: 30S ribosomal protein S6 [Acidobacteriota bacterium]|nr:30S ribosomal protein S6 [Acidobacteriota bacterium]